MLELLFIIGYVMSWFVGSFIVICLIQLISYRVFKFNLYKFIMREVSK